MELVGLELPAMAPFGTVSDGIAAVDAVPVVATSLGAG